MLLATLSSGTRAHPVLWGIFKLLSMPVTFSSCCSGPAALGLDSSQLTVQQGDWAGYWVTEGDCEPGGLTQAQDK